MGILPGEHVCVPTGVPKCSTQTAPPPRRSVIPSPMDLVPSLLKRKTWFSSGHLECPMSAVPSQEGDDAMSANATEHLGRSQSHRNAEERIGKDLDKIHRAPPKRKEGEPEHWLIDSPWFNWTIAFIVGMNCVHMGVEADFPEWPALWSMEVGFTCCFTAEMLVKVCVLGKGYFEDRWNWVDFFLVMLALSDLLIEIVTSSNSQLQALSVLRVLRLVRLVRIVRLVKTFHKLVLVVQGVVDAMFTTFWVGCMLLLAIYIGAIFCVMFLGHDKGSKYPGYSVDPLEIDESEMMENFNPYLSFGSLGKSMITLFNVAILAEWAEVVQPIMVKDPLLVTFFIGYVVFVTFGLMNVMIGMIVDSVMQNASDLQALEHAENKKRKKKILGNIGELAAHIDKDGNKFVDIEELEEVMADEDTSGFKEMMCNVELPIGFTAKELMRMLDTDGDGRLQREEFVEAFYRLIDSNDFQRICMIQTGLNEIKSIVKLEAREAHKHREKLEKRIRHVEHHSSELSSYIHRTDKTTASHRDGVHEAHTVSSFCSSAPSAFNNTDSTELASYILAVDKKIARGEVLLSSERSSLCSSSQAQGAFNGMPRRSASNLSTDTALNGLDTCQRSSACNLGMDAHSTEVSKAAEVQSEADRKEAAMGLPPAAPDFRAEPTHFAADLGMARSRHGAPDHEPERHGAPDHAPAERCVHHFDESVRQLGLEIAYANSFPSIVSVAPGGEAERRDVGPGDIIVAINSENTERQPREEILRQLRARPLFLEVRRGTLTHETLS